MGALTPGAYYHGLGNRNPADMGPAVRRQHMGLVEARSVLEKYGDEFFVRGTYHIGHVPLGCSVSSVTTRMEGCLIYQRSSENVVVGAKMGFKESVVLLPYGKFILLENGREFEGGRAVLVSQDVKLPIFVKVG